MAILVQDTFTDTNGTQLSSHSPDIGGAWIDPIFSVEEAQIQSNKLLVGFDAFYYNDISNVADVYVQIDCVTDGASLLAGLVVRYTDSSNYYYYDPGFGIKKLVGGTPTTIAAYADAQTAGSTYKLEAIGTTLTLYKDGSPVASTTDSDLTTGKPGFAPRGTGATLDNFEAGDAAPSTPPDTPTGFTATCVKNTAPSIIDITADPTGGEAPLDVDFSVGLTGTTPFTYLWEFGEGSTSTDAAPSFQYTDPGIYQVRLTVTNSLGSDTLTQSIMVTDEGIQLPPIAAFTADAQSGPSPLSVSFTDTSTGSPEEWEWYIGDVLQDTTQNFNHTFNSDGTYIVELRVKKDGIWETAYSLPVVVSPDTNLPPIVTSISSSQTSSGTGTLTTTFSATVDGTPTSYLWNFGDGHTSTGTSPTHTYSAPGVYTVTLTTTNADGSTTATMQVVVAQIAGGAMPGGGRPVIGGKEVGYYIADSGNHRIMVFELDGGFITTFGSLGVAEGKFNFPTSLTLSGSTQLIDRIEID